MAERNLRVTVIGHVAVDLTTTLDDVELKIVEGKFSNYDRRFQNRLGGTGPMLALAAREFGCATSVIGKVGADPFGRIAVAELQARGIEPLVTATPARATGTVVMLYLKDDARILLADRGANAELGPEDLTAEVRQKLCASDLVLASGYTFLDTKAREAVCLAMRIARDAGAFVAFDVVPHTLYRLFPFAEFVALTASAHALALELNTARRFLELESHINRAYDEAETAQIVARLLAHYPLLIIYPANDRVVIADDPHPERWRIQPTGYRADASADRRAFLDRVFVRTIYEYLSDHRAERG